MPKKYPLLSLKEFEDIIRTFEIVGERTKGGHRIVVVQYNGQKITLPYPIHQKNMPKKVIKNTIENLGLSVEEFYSRTKVGEKKLGKKKGK